MTKKNAQPTGLGKSRKAWANYEEAARYMLQQIGKRFGLAEVQGKQKVVGLRSGTTWEIDAKGVRDGDGSVVLVECRHYKERLNQEALAAVAFRIIDIGAVGGITVSPLPLQKGAAKVAKASRIEHVRLRPESSRELWIAEIGKVFHIGATADVTFQESFDIILRDAAGNVVDRRSG
ncbi:hypothetical protein LJR090_001798 [Bosea sp. LjRoot90]|uniref:hypothetical protein n=1 Tax=Bosea sp. LjRoot90 TaxID=3342342 RepID=UPI003ED15EB5